jgi:hypothetical protein
MTTEQIPHITLNKIKQSINNYNNSLYNCYNYLIKIKNKEKKIIFNKKYLEAQDSLIFLKYCLKNNHIDIYDYILFNKIQKLNYYTEYNNYIRYVNI